MSSTPEITADDAKDIDVNSMGPVASVVIGSGVALLPLFLGPVLVGEYIAKLAVSESQAGFIISTEMAGFTLGSALLFVIAGLNWRKIMTVAVLLLVAGNVSVSLIDNLSLFILCRFVAGLGSGLVMTMTILVVGLMRDTDRVYGMWAVGQLAFGAAGMVVFPGVIAAYGIDYVFLSWAILAGLLGISIRYYPSGRRAQSEVNGVSGLSRKFILGLVCLLGLLVYYSGQTAVWVYMELIGISWGIERAVVGDILFLSLLAAIVGSGMAVLLGNKMGRAIPLSISMVLSAVSIMCLIVLNGKTLFTMSACLFNFAWYLFVPYVSAIVAAVDDDGKLLTGLAVTFPAGLTAGPAIAALLIGDGNDLLPCLLFGLVSVPLGLGLILPADRYESAKT